MSALSTEICRKQGKKIPGPLRERAGVGLPAADQIGKRGRVVSANNRRLYLWQSGSFEVVWLITNYLH